ncbi:MAG: hypothetical protein D6732_00115 [Methanobacteriota archaeon]|nr:MAG: hypothetical protein D6732_00115 [Euryarchaeota archaeon]
MWINAKFLSEYLDDVDMSFWMWQAAVAFASGRVKTTRGLTRYLHGIEKDLPWKPCSFDKVKKQVVEAFSLTPPKNFVRGIQSTLTGEQAERFWAFWEAYAHPVSLPKAADAWASLERKYMEDGFKDGIPAIEFNKIVRCAKIDASIRKDSRFTPHAHTWLMGREWESGVYDHYHLEEENLPSVSDILRKRMKKKDRTQ